LGIGDWGLGIGDLGFWAKPPTPHPQTPNPQSPIPIKFGYKIIKKTFLIEIIIINKFK